MKNKLWLFQLPLILACTFAFYVNDLSVEGRIENRFFRETLFRPLRTISADFTDLKFKLRGPIKPKNKVVVVAIDDDSIEQIGRWPWHRDAMAILIEKTFEAGAKVVGMDIAFSEPDRRVSEELAAQLRLKLQGKVPDSELQDLFSRVETDPMLGQVIAGRADQLVLGVIPSLCQPLYDSSEDCRAVDNPQAMSQIPQGFEKFSMSIQNKPKFDPHLTPIPSAVSVISNLPEYDAVASHSGPFDVSTSIDPDGYIRRVAALYLLNKKAYPDLPLEMGRVGLHDYFQVDIANDGRIRSLKLAKSGQEIPVSPVGALSLNFRGGAGAFPRVSAKDVINWNGPVAAPGRTLASSGSDPVADTLKDAYVLIGATAIGIFDMRAFPFDSNVPGVEGHATALDNLLANDFLTSGHGPLSSKWLYLVMILGGALFAFFAQKLEAVPALILTILTFSGVGIIDLKVLFAHNINWDTGFLYVELFSIFIFTLAAKYAIEENNKKFVRSAFTKYVAPAVVDSILKDPAKLTVGGEKKDLTILFSDIRGFTTFSERMDAKSLSSFLNDYLSVQTKIIFDHHGTLDKYIGDAIMAFWGAPLDQPEHAANACLSAIAMMKALEENKERFKKQYGVDLEVGIGLNSGTVSVGNMGSSENFAYTVIGDHVNLASRLEGLTKYYGAGIVTSRYTFDLIEKAGKSLPSHRVLDSVKVKGKQNAVELIEIFTREMSREGLELFEEARRAYLAQNWARAAELFAKASPLLGRAGKDGPSEMYLARIAEFQAGLHSLENWDGSWEMHSK